MQELLPYDPDMKLPELISCKVIFVNPDQGQSIIKALAEDFPLPKFNLGHIKRIQKHPCGGKLEDLLGPSTHDFSSIETRASECEHCESSLVSKEIPKLPPYTVEQSRIWSKVWPVVYRQHENQAYQHTLEELQKIEEIFEINLRRENAIVYDPLSKNLWEGKQGENILAHPIMQAIENFSPEGDQYYCTGFWCFIYDEPCVMCGMALVHSRFERVYFAKKNRRKGAFTHWNLHLKALNHMYRVFIKKQG